MSTRPDTDPEPYWMLNGVDVCLQVDDLVQVKLECDLHVDDVQSAHGTHKSAEPVS